MNKQNFTNREKTAIKKFLEHYDSYLQTKDYSDSSEFLDCNVTAEDMIKYHKGMQFMAGQMLHELKFIKTPKQFRAEERERLERLEIIRYQ